jgi:hypothetical protein
MPVGVCCECGKGGGEKNERGRRKQKRVWVKEETTHPRHPPRVDLSKQGERCTPPIVERVLRACVFWLRHVFWWCERVLGRSVCVVCVCTRAL